MRELDFEILTWLGAAGSGSTDEATVASFKITAGPDRIPVTEVEDTIARTVRTHINVSAHAVARWLIVNWWRLRWEPSSRSPSSDWNRTHSLAAIGGGYAWPALQLASDGEFLQLQLRAEAEADVSAVRYLRDVTLEIPVAHFEAAVESLTDQVQARLAAFPKGSDELSELRAELSSEQIQPELAQACKLQALAGIDPGAAAPEWLAAAEKLTQQAGPVAGDEIMAVLPGLDGSLEAASRVMTAMRGSLSTLKLDQGTDHQLGRPPGLMPWQKGASLAAEMRTRLGVQAGPLTNAVLERSLEVKLPLPLSSWTGARSLEGGFRNGINGGRTAVLVTRPGYGQRFYLARLIGAAMVSHPDQHVLPVSDAATALQKFQRSFAQELLCPWVELDAFTDDKGTDEDGVEEAAKHFHVSEWLILTTLVNRKKLGRNRLRLS